MTDSDWTSQMQQHPDKLQLPGAMLMKYGPSDYVGAAFAFTGTLFFDGAHEKAVRDQICDCFDEYAAVAGDHLTWLWREEPPSGPDVQPYADAKPMRKLAADTHEDDLFSFFYTGGERREDASPLHVPRVRGARMESAQIEKATISSRVLAPDSADGAESAHSAEAVLLVRETAEAVARLCRSQSGDVACAR